MKREDNIKCHMMLGATREEAELIDMEGAIIQKHAHEIVDVMNGTLKRSRKQFVTYLVTLIVTLLHTQPKEQRHAVYEVVEEFIASDEFKSEENLGEKLLGGLKDENRR